jgi:hypothetical protein
LSLWSKDLFIQVNFRQLLSPPLAARGELGRGGGDQGEGEEFGGCRTASLGGFLSGVRKLLVDRIWNRAGELF